MAETKANNQRTVSPVKMLIILAMALAGGSLFWYLETHRHTDADLPPVLTPEAKGYVKFLQLSDVGMKATGSYLGGDIVEIIGNVTNSGERNLQLVEINCVFYDPYGQLVLRQRVPIVSRKMGGLKPGETKPFRLPFDNLPESWNKAMPQLVIARVDFN